MRRFALATVTVTLAGCASVGGSDYKAPRHFTVSDGAVKAVIRGAINHTTDSPGLKGGIEVTCIGERSCQISYTVKQPAGISTGSELVDPTRQIWKAMFEDRRFRRGAITVEGPLTSVGGKSSTGPVLTLACTRAAARQINWNQVGSSGIESLCEYTRLVKGI